MNLMTKGEIKFKINDYDRTSSVFKTLKPTGSIYIPRYIEKSGQKYIITSISKNSFSNQKIDSINFPKDSEITFFDYNSFSGTHIKTLQIPSSLVQLKDGWCKGIIGLVDIKVSPLNKMFSYIENNFLVGKSIVNNNKDVFDILYYARFDIKEATIPASIRVIKQYAFDRHEKLTSIIFPENSELEKIELFAFKETAISRILLPSKLNEIEPENFSSLQNLIEIDVMPNNETFSSVDKKYLLRKSSLDSHDFDVFVTCCRDVEQITIPQNIRMIEKGAFQFCTKLKSIVFEGNSSLKVIDNSAFTYCRSLRNIVLPSTLKCIGQHSFSFASHLESVVFLSRTIEVGLLCFNDCLCLSVLSFRNARRIDLIDRDSLRGIPKRTRIEVREDAELIGSGFELIMNQIEFNEHEISQDVFEEEESDEEQTSIKQNEEVENKKDKIKNENQIILEEEESDNDQISTENNNESESSHISTPKSNEKSEEFNSDYIKSDVKEESDQDNKSIDKKEEINSDQNGESDADNFD